MQRIQLNTPKRIADQLACSAADVRYVLKKSNIDPVAYADRTPLFDSEAIPRIRYLINRLHAHRIHRRAR